MIDRGDLHTVELEPDEARALFMESAQINRKKADLDPQDMVEGHRYAMSLDMLAKLDEERGDAQSALDRYQESLAWIRPVAASNAGNLSLQSDLLYYLIRFGYLQNTLGNFTAAIAAFEEAEVITAILRSSDYPDNAVDNALIEFLRTFAESLRRAGDDDRARYYNQELRAAIEDKIRTEDPDDYYQAMFSITEFNDGILAFSAGDYSAAIASFEQSIAILDPLIVNKEGMLAYGADTNLVLNQLGEALIRHEEPEKALPVIERSLSIAMEIHALNADNLLHHHSVFSTRRILGNVKSALQQYNEAYNEHFEALAIIESLLEENMGNVSWQHDAIIEIDTMAMLLFNNGAYENATTLFDMLYERSSRLLNDFPGDETILFYAKDSREFYALSLGSWSNELLLAGYTGEAVVKAQLALKLFPESLLVKSYLANAYLINGNEAQARLLYLGNVGGTFPNEVSWEDGIASDFELLRNNGIDHPSMTGILEQLVE